MTTSGERSEGEDVAFGDRYGLHPRAAHRIVQAVAGLDATISIERRSDGQRVDPTSMLALVGAGIRQGDVVRVHAEGPDAVSAVERVTELIRTGVCHA
jgi:phosphotransferase system HPr (HPr) family protein